MVYENCSIVDDKAIEQFLFLQQINQIIQISMSQLRLSRIREEKVFYLKYNAEGATQVSKLDTHFDETACYREVHNLDKAAEDHKGPKLYDDDYQIDLGIQFEKDDSVIVRRLSTLYPLSNRPPFFDINSPPSRPVDPKQWPHCLNELALFPITHYRSLFITQDYSPSGKYILIINVNGRFEVISVDDRIPVNQKTLEPIWGLSYKNPWELILVKALAKKLQGYNRISKLKPFEFIESFSNPTWRYYNLTKSPGQFLRKYRTIKSQYAKIVLKTKAKEEIEQNGLLHDSASYEIVKGVVEEQNGKEVGYFAIRGTSKSSWPGTYSFLDKKASEIFHQKLKSPEISLERCFLISAEDLLNNFSAAYFTSVRRDSYFTGYRIIDIEADEKKAQYFQFEIKSEGFFDFCIKQFPQNKLKATNHPSLSKTDDAKRFLQTKYMLVRDNYSVKQTSNSLQLPNQPAMQNSLTNSKIDSNNEYVQPRFSLYEIEYLKGYNKGEAHFLYLPKGRYILRFKSELASSHVQYSISWVSSTCTSIQESKITSEEKVDLLHQAIVSFMHKGQHYSIHKDKKTEMISYGNTFEEIGYGFFSVKTTVNCPNSILIEVNPKILTQEGYVLKGRFKDEKQVFKIRIQKGEFQSVVLKASKYAKDHIWPTKAFKVLSKVAEEADFLEDAMKSMKSEEANNNTLNNPQSAIKLTDSRDLKPEEEKSKQQEKPKEQEKPEEVEDIQNELPQH